MGGRRKLYPIFRGCPSTGRPPAPAGGPDPGHLAPIGNFPKTPLGYYSRFEAYLEDSPSGLWRTPGTRVGLTALGGSNPPSSARWNAAPTGKSVGAVFIVRSPCAEAELWAINVCLGRGCPALPAHPDRAQRPSSAVAARPSSSGPTNQSSISGRSGVTGGRHHRPLVPRRGRPQPRDQLRKRSGARPVDRPTDPRRTSRTRPEGL